jgi:6-pyruvoyltetrahydropterin/6-carboxytetrahydropterin synthase
MYTLEVEGDFAAAHQLREYAGKCERLHGHNWRVRLAVQAETLPASGMLVDFGELKRILGECLEAYDHGFLNEIPPFDGVNPTSERLARAIADAAAAKLPPHARVSAVTVWESDRCSATYRP